jgi:hypothetical protein
MSMPMLYVHAKTDKERDIVMVMGTDKDKDKNTDKDTDADADMDADKNIDKDEWKPTF